MLRLMADPILFAGEPALGALRTALVPAKEVLAVAVEVLAQIARPQEDGFRGAGRVSASPGPVVGVQDAVVVKV